MLFVVACCSFSSFVVNCLLCVVRGVSLLVMVCWLLSVACCYLLFVVCCAVCVVVCCLCVGVDCRCLLFAI